MVSKTELGATGIADLKGGVFCVNVGTTVERALTDDMKTDGIEYDPLAFDKGEELRANPPTASAGRLLGSTPGVGAHLGLSDG